MTIRNTKAREVSAPKKLTLAHLSPVERHHETGQINQNPAHQQIKQS